MTVLFSQGVVVIVLGRTTISCPAWWKSGRKSWPRRHWNLSTRCESNFLGKRTRKRSSFWTRYRHKQWGSSCKVSEHGALCRLVFLLTCMLAACMVFSIRLLPHSFISIFSLATLPLSQVLLSLNQFSCACCLHSAFVRLSLWHGWCSGLWYSHNNNNYVDLSFSLWCPECSHDTY